jgi:hypothetical protein
MQHVLTKDSQVQTTYFSQHVLDIPSADLRFLGLYIRSLGYTSVNCDNSNVDSGCGINTDLADDSVKYASGGTTHLISTHRN